MIGPTRASTSGARSDSPPPPTPGPDDAVPGPSGANANPDNFDTSRAEVARVLSGGQRRGRGAGKRSQPQGDAAGAAKRSRSEFNSDNHEVNQALASLKTLCNDKGIEITDSLYKLLSLCPPEKQQGLINKMICFFSNVDPLVVKNTQTITSMIGQSNVARRIQRLLEINDEEIAAVARCQHLNHIASMQNSKGFPSIEAVNNLLSRPLLQKAGVVNEPLLKLLSTMRSGRGVPDEFTAMDGLLSLPALCPGGELDLSLLGAVAVMCTSQGFPSTDSVTSLLSLECLQSNDGSINQELLKAVSLMCRRHGIPDAQRTKDLLTMQSLKDNPALLRTITNMCDGCYLPQHEDVRTLLQLPCLNKRDNDQNVVFDLQAFECIASTQFGRRLPNSERVTQLLTLLSKDGQLDYKVLHCVSALYHKKGLPGEAELERLLALPDMRTESKVNLALLRTVAALGRGNGFPNDDIINQAQRYLGQEYTQQRAGLISELLTFAEGGIDFTILGRLLKSMDAGTVRRRVVAAPRATPRSGRTTTSTRRTTQATVTATTLAAAKQVTLTEEKKPLLALCKERKIIVARSLHEIIDYCPATLQQKLIKHITHFLTHLDTTQSNTTATLTSMLGPKDKFNTLLAFLKMSEENVASIAKSQQLKAIACMCNGKGLPEPADVQALLSMPELQAGRRLNVPRFRAIASMYNSMGIPSTQSVKDLLAAPVFTTGGQFNQEIFSIIAAIFQSKGFPDNMAVDGFLKHEVFKGINGQLDMDRLKSIAVMCRKKGLPDAGALTGLMNSEHFKTNGRFDRQKLTPVHTMFNAKGLPTVAQMDTLFSLPALQVDGQISLPLLRLVASMGRGRGMPEVGQVTELLTMRELLVQGKPSIDVLNAIAAFYSGKGIPSSEEVKGLWGVHDLLGSDGQLDIKLLSCITTMHYGKKIPDLSELTKLLAVEALRSDGKPEFERIKCISRLFRTKGLPQAQKVEELLAQLSTDGQLDLRLLKRVAILGACKGIPTNAVIRRARVEVQARGYSEDDDPDEGDSIEMDDVIDAHMDVDDIADDQEMADVEPRPQASTTPPATARVEAIPQTSAQAEATPHSSAAAASPEVTFALPDNYNLNQAAAGLSLNFWEDFLNAESTSDTSAESQEPTPGTSAESRSSSPSPLARHSTDQEMADVEEAPHTSAQVEATSHSSAAAASQEVTFALPDNYDLNQAAAGLNISYWDSMMSTDTEPPSPDDVEQTSAVGLDFWEDFLNEESTSDTSAESQGPTPGTSAESRPGSPSLLAKPRRFLAERDDKT